MKHPHFQHRVPFWVEDQRRFFITVCAQQRGLNHFSNSTVGPDALAAARKYHDEKRWYCSLIVLMPDHVHLIVSMEPGHDLAKSIGLWKRWLWKRHSIEWQPNFFEHRLRGGESPEAKWQYVYQNPVRAELIERPGDWPWTWMPDRQ